MRKGLVKVSSLRRAGMMCCGVGCVIACSAPTPADHPYDAPKPTVTAPSTSHVSATPPSSPQKPQRLYTFHGEASPATKSVWVKYEPVVYNGQRKPGLSTQDTLPEGPSGVVAHTVLGSVIYDTTSTPGCGGTDPDPHICGSVEIVNNLPDAVTGTTVVIESTSPSSVIAVGAPYFYGDVSGKGATSSPIEWVFDDSGKTDFSFSGSITGTPQSCSTICGGPTPFCEVATSTCVQCLESNECPPGNGESVQVGCIEGTCI